MRFYSKQDDPEQNFILNENVEYNKNELTKLIIYTENLFAAISKTTEFKFSYS